MKKRIIAVIVFMIMTIATLYRAQDILKAKFIQDSTTIVDGFYEEKKNDIDVLFIGSSNCFCTIDPLVLYDEYGIAAYNFASSSQSMDLSLLYLKEALKSQNPKVVALEVNYIPGQNTSGLGEDSMLWGLTQMPLTVDKLTCIYQLVGKVDEEYMSYVFPLLRYHERWKEISRQDYIYASQDKTNWTKGYMRTDLVSETPVDLSGYMEEGDAWLDERAVACLKEMAQICKEKDIDLLLFKSPRNGWYQYLTKEMEELAKECDIDFLDYNGLIKETGLDVATDFRDIVHLNNQGAAKVSSHMGGYLKEHFALPDRREDEEENSWDVALAYQERLQINESYFSQAQTVTECKEILDSMDEYAAILTYKGGKDKVQYQWIYKSGNPVLSKVWKEDGVAHKKIADTDIVLARQNKGLQILVNGENHYTPNQNWSVIVCDLKTNAVVANLNYEE